MTNSLFGDLFNPNLAPDAAETFDRANAPAPKRVASTSIEAYRAITPELPQREHEVLIGLRRYYAVYRRWPTAYELLRWMQTEGVAFDVNSVRPRLTALRARGRVRQADKRPCTVTRRTVFTWVIEDNQEV